MCRHTEIAEGFAKNEIEKNPRLKPEIEELVQLMHDEIEQGGSPAHESELCISSINDLLRDN